MDEQKMIAEYLKVGGVKCINPDCGSKDIESTNGKGPTNNYDGSYSLNVVCNVCGSTWTDIYMLNDVKDINIKNEGW